MSQISDEDKSLFEAAVAGAQKLKETPKTETFRKRRSTKVGTLRDRDNYSTEGSSPPPAIEPVSAYASLSFERPGIRPQDLRKLRQGKFKTHWQLDLHGQTEAQAEQTLHSFILDAEKAQVRYLLIIHGKGHNSDRERPVLKNLVNWRLRQFNSVLAFCSAQPKDGGAGAVYVLLQKQ